MREENRLRRVWNEDYKSNKEKSTALYKAVKETGIEPFEQPERYPSVDRNEVRLVCWLAVIPKN
jgi:hypothetical protein